MARGVCNPKLVSPLQIGWAFSRVRLGCYHVTAPTNLFKMADCKMNTTQNVVLQTTSVVFILGNSPNFNTRAVFDTIGVFLKHKVFVSLLVVFVIIRKWLRMIVHMNTANTFTVTVPFCEIRGRFPLMITKTTHDTCKYTLIPLHFPNITHLHTETGNYPIANLLNKAWNHGPC